MSFPFGTFDVIEDVNCDPSSMCLIGLRYKSVPVVSGEPIRFKDVVDWEATGRSSAVITNIGVENE